MELFRKRHGIVWTWTMSISTICKFLGLLTLLPSLVDSQLCTKSVSVPSTDKVRTVKRIPAKCSNWDRSWVWLTRMDCGTKYVIEYVKYPKAAYKIQYVCCEHDEECKAGKKASRSGLDESEERFLAITFGTATAVLALLCIIFFISFCHKQRYRFGFWKRRRHEYESTEGIDPAGCNMDERQENDYIYDDRKIMEPDYEEIRDINQDYPDEKPPIIESDITQAGSEPHDNSERVEPTAPPVETAELQNNVDLNSPEHVSSGPVKNSHTNNSVTGSDQPPENANVDVLQLADFNQDISSAFSLMQGSVNNSCDFSENVEPNMPTEHRNQVSSATNNATANEYANAFLTTCSDGNHVDKHGDRNNENGYEHLDPSKRDGQTAQQPYDALILAGTNNDYQNLSCIDTSS